jgi:excinuclease ABC subunit B
MTDSMRQAIGETSRRRAKQQAYNLEHNITPQSIVKAVDMQLAAIVEADYVTVPADAPAAEIANEEELLRVVAGLETQMREAAKNFEFERAAALRDRIRSLKQRDLGFITSTEAAVLASAAGALPGPSSPNAVPPAVNELVRPHRTRSRAPRK